MVTVVADVIRSRDKDFIGCIRPGPDPGVCLGKQPSSLLVKTVSQPWAVLSPGDVWQCPDTFLVAACGVGRACSAAAHPGTPRTAHTEKSVGPSVAGVKAEKPWVENSRLLHGKYLLSVRDCSKCFTGINWLNPPQVTTGNSGAWEGK